jgi:hypothetical protein
MILNIGEHVYYQVESDHLWIGWFKVGDFKRKDHAGKWTYKYIGVL